jgi:hypothetical protein
MFRDAFSCLSRKNSSIWWTSVNEYILKSMIENSEGVEILTQSKVPPGVGGIALGQVY